MTLYDQISLRIVRQQELVIGPLAWSEAVKVSGFKIIDQKKGEVELVGDPKQILNNLVAQYARLFGNASNEVCKEAAQDLLAELPADQMPTSLL